MNEYSVGQVVWVMVPYRAGDIPGTVIKVGRKLVTVQSQRGQDQFRMDTGRINDPYGNVRIETTEARAKRLREALVIAALDRAGLRVGFHSRLTVEQLESAARAIGALTDDEQG